MNIFENKFCLVFEELNKNNTDSIKLNVKTIKNPLGIIRLSLIELYFNIFYLISEINPILLNNINTKILQIINYLLIKNYDNQFIFIEFIKFFKFIILKKQEKILITIFIKLNLLGDINEYFSKYYKNGIFINKKEIINFLDICKYIVYGLNLINAIGNEPVIEFNKDNFLIIMPTNQTKFKRNSKKISIKDNIKNLYPFKKINTFLNNSYIFSNFSEIINNIYGKQYLFINDLEKFKLNYNLK